MGSEGESVPPSEKQLRIPARFFPTSVGTATEEKQFISVLHFLVGSSGRSKRADFGGFFEAGIGSRRLYFQACGVFGIAPEFVVY
jgi:hypothetical protein